MNKLVTILGPTAVGKTDLSLALARQYGAELISGDAYQVYRHMDIGTAKPSPEELRQYRHHLIDIIGPGDTYTAAQFCQMAAAAAEAIEGRGKLPILVGGTGLYVQALLEGYRFDAPPPDPALRQRARERMEKSSEGELQAYIRQETDWQPQDWHELLCNTHRLLRLLEAIEAGDGRSYIDARKEGLCCDALVVGLILPREVLYNRINKRVDMMLAQGWVEEVAWLLEQGISPESQSMKAIGYGELAAYLQGNLSLAEAAEAIKQRTRRFAKRQLTWYKRMPYIQWFHKDEYASEEALAQAVMTAVEHKWGNSVNLI